MSMTIAKILDGLPRLRVFDEDLKTFEDVNPFVPLYPVVDKTTYLGIEVEIENVRTWGEGAGTRSPYWNTVEDGYLRNHGAEFITPPIRAWRTEHALNRLFSEVNKDIEFTERTSVHVHMNIRTLTIEQLEAFLITYLVFEKLLFDFIGQDRSKNIFCVPLTETNNGLVIQSIIRNKNLSFPWSKYTALNLLPIREKGTVEFRHMHGTKDIKKLMTWINIILCLKVFALKNPPEYIWEQVRALNTSSQYELFAQEVFGDLAQTLWSTDKPQSKIAECVSYIKNKCIQNTFKQTIFVEGESPLANYIGEKPTSYERDLNGTPLSAMLERTVINSFEDEEPIVDNESITWNLTTQDALNRIRERHMRNMAEVDAPQRTSVPSMAEILATRPIVRPRRT